MLGLLPAVPWFLTNNIAASQTKTEGEEIRNITAVLTKHIQTRSSQGL